ncbi:MAG: conjugal transfer protein TraT [Gammaproteobacteria bacterium]|nr:conjugal transfer protein TraT [Gammaproteobacteria bacterium]
MKGIIKKHLSLISSTVLVAALTGCAATQTVIEHGRLTVNTQQSKSIFMEPVSNNQKTVFISVKNNTEEEVHIASSLKERLSQNGYKVLNSADKAHYILQTNILQIGKMSASASSSALGGGFGSAIAGATAGAAIGSFTNTTNGIVAGGLSGGVLGLAADALVKDVSYTMVTDVQITEHKAKALKRYRTRIISSANQVNLKFKDAKPLLERGLVKSISGIF